jgi:hypothetical protein
MERKTKSMAGRNGQRKLASDAGRAHANSGGEPHKDREVPRGSGRRAGSSKQRKG